MLTSCASDAPSTAALAQLLPKCQQVLHVRAVAPHLLSRGDPHHEGVRGAGARGRGSALLPGCNGREAGDAAAEEAGRRGRAAALGPGKDVRGRQSIDEPRRAHRHVAEVLTAQRNRRSVSHDERSRSMIIY